MDDPQIKKLYYSISEVSERFDVKPHVLRYWETEFPQLRPRKNRAGHRTYTAADLTLIEEIVALLRRKKYTIEGARRVLRTSQQGVSEQAMPDLESELTDLRVFLSKLLEKL